MESLSLPTHSPTALLGQISLIVAIVLAAYTLVVGALGARRRDDRLVKSSLYGLLAFSGVMVFASALLVYAFLTHDYSLKYVAAYSDTSMPFWYKVTAYWGGLSGSMMFWVFVLSVFSSIAVWMNRQRHRDMLGYVIATIMVVQIFFLAVILFTDAPSKNPFDTFLADAPQDGKGLNPLLQNYWMIIHPPSLYIGFVAATIPFAFCIGALASGRLDDSWIYSIRVWMFVCWFFLSFGLVLGGRWAYEELGWGGYWAWDPVENAGFIPWFTATAVLHSFIIQEQRGTMKVWNVTLVIFTFFLTIFGTFMTRSGVVQSVHAFGEDNQLALLFILFMAAIWIFSIGLIVYRLPRLRSKGAFDSFVSREFAFLLNNWILLSCALFVLFATMFPTISEAVNGQRITVGPPFFNKWMVPLALVLLLLAGAAPLLAWRKSTTKRLMDQFLVPVAVSVVIMGALAIIFPRTLTLTSIFSNKIKFPVAIVNFGIIAFTLSSCAQEFYKGMRVRSKQTGSDPFTSLIGITLAKRRRYGGYVIHMGIAVMFIGFAGKAFDHEEDFTLTNPGTALASQEGYDLAKYRDLTEACRGSEKTPACAPAQLRQQAALPESMTTAAMIEKCANGQLSDCVMVKGYVFRYDKFVRCPDLDGRPECKGSNGDHKTTYTGYVTVFTKEGEHVTDMDPGRWVFAKLPDQPTTEPSINVDGVDDIYLAMLGFQEGKADVANFRLFLNPLINWVWLGFVLLMIGTAICLVPESVARRMRKSPASKLGKLGDVAVLVLIVGACTLLSVRAAYGQSPGGAGPVYQDAPSHGGASAAHEARPDSATAKKLMKGIGCMCGGCNKEPIHDCDCSFAAQERARVLGLLQGKNLTTDEGRELAYLEVRDAFIAKYGEEVLVMPLDEGFNRVAWALPYAALGGALALIFAGGRKWVRRGKAGWAADVAHANDLDLEDDPAADKLDDELAQID